MTEKTKVLIVDDQMIARGFFEMHINAAEQYELVGSVGNADTAVAFCEKHPVDIVIMDVLMRLGSDGLTAAQRMKRMHPAIKLIVVTSMPEYSYLKRAREIGVESFWYKEYSEISLTEVLDRTAAGESVYPDEAPVILLGKAVSTELTKQELAVLKEMTTGATNNEIAERLCISVNTVKSHIQHMLKKTGYNSKIKLAVDARALGIAIGEE